MNLDLDALKPRCVQVGEQLTELGSREAVRWNFKEA